MEIGVWRAMRAILPFSVISVPPWCIFCPSRRRPLSEKTPWDFFTRSFAGMTTEETNDST